jgi:RecB family exonuclease
VVTLLVDEGRLAAGLAPAIAEHVASAHVLTPAMLLESLIGARVVGESERRAILRALARSRDDVGLSGSVIESASFAHRAAAALDQIDHAERAFFEPLIAHYRTLLAFGNVYDERSALAKAIAESPVRARPHLLVDAALLDGERGFVWRRLFAAQAIDVELIALGPLLPPAFDRGLIDAVRTLVRYAAYERDADARRVALGTLSPIAPDDASALVVGAGERGLLEAIASGKASLSPADMHAALRLRDLLAAIVSAYRAPDAGAGSVLGAIVVATGVATDATPTTERTLLAIAQIARDFDSARALAATWEAGSFLADLAAETGTARAAAPALADADPLPAREREPARAVTIRKTHFSASSLNAYAECRRKWYYRYVCSAVEDRGSSASFYGTAFHAALEEFHEKYPRVDGVERATLERFLEACINGAFDRFRTRFDAVVEFELQKRRARRTAGKYVKWILERMAREPFSVIGNEVSADLDLDGHAFVGYIDRLDRDDRSGGVTVVDYKTGTIAQSAAEYREKIVNYTDFQLPFYYWARTAAGDRVTRLSLIPLKDALLDVAPVELEIALVPAGSRRNDRSTVGTIGIGDLERAKAKMIELASEIAGGGLADFPATDDPDACTYCAYRNACRERPAAVDARFGR